MKKVILSVVLLMCVVLVLSCCRLKQSNADSNSSQPTLPAINTTEPEITPEITIGQETTCTPKEETVVDTEEPTTGPQESVSATTTPEEESPDTNEMPESNPAETTSIPETTEGTEAATEETEATIDNSEDDNWDLGGF